MHRVLPDGCIDIIFKSRGAESSLEVAGAMNRAHIFELEPGSTYLGVRFRPGAAYRFLGAASNEFTDRSIDLSSLWPKQATLLQDLLAATSSETSRLDVLAGSLHPPDGGDHFDQALDSIVKQSGCVSLDQTVRATGLSNRQFRRLCLLRVGLSPKQFCRVVRFRRAVGRLRSALPQSHAEIAVACGYYDQAHLIKEIREFSGLTPRQMIAAGQDDRFFQDTGNPSIGNWTLSEPGATSPCQEEVS